MNKATNVLVLVLAAIGALALVALATMWLMHATMMGGPFAPGP